ncbi:MAG: hypothetical protein HQ536_02285 [Parcubacteria group bacterium]|nr:hypothetical protein [Parcubacteria group bacterium]
MVKGGRMVRHPEFPASQQGRAVQSREEILTALHIADAVADAATSRELELLRELELARTEAKAAEETCLKLVDEFRHVAAEAFLAVVNISDPASIPTWYIREAVPKPDGLCDLFTDDILFEDEGGKVVAPHPDYSSSLNAVVDGPPVCWWDYFLTRAFSVRKDAEAWAEEESFLRTPQG